MGAFRVEPDRLRQTIDQVEETEDVLDGLRYDLVRIAGAMEKEQAVGLAVGSHHISEFVERWSREFELIKEMVLRMSSSLEKAAEHYDEMDTQLAEALQQLTPSGQGRFTTSADALERS